VGGFRIRRLERLGDAELEALVAILHDCVQGGPDGQPCVVTIFYKQLDA
jgi:hypothetical protein